jgi:hypothetical protein
MRAVCGQAINNLTMVAETKADFIERLLSPDQRLASDSVTVTASADLSSH